MTNYKSLNFILNKFATEVENEVCEQINEEEDDEMTSKRRKIALKYTIEVISFIKKFSTNNHFCQFPLLGNWSDALTMLDAILYRSAPRSYEEKYIDDFVLGSIYDLYKGHIKDESTSK